MTSLIECCDSEVVRRRGEGGEEAVVSGDVLREAYRRVSDTRDGVLYPCNGARGPDGRLTVDEEYARDRFNVFRCPLGPVSAGPLHASVSSR